MDTNYYQDFDDGAPSFTANLGLDFDRLEPSVADPTISQLISLKYASDMLKIHKYQLRYLIYSVMKRPLTPQ